MKRILFLLIILTTVSIAQDKKFYGNVEIAGELNAGTVVGADTALSSYQTTEVENLIDDSTDVLEAAIATGVTVGDSLASDVADLVTVDDSLASDIADVSTIQDSLVSDISERLEEDFTTYDSEGSLDGNDEVIIYDDDEDEVNKATLADMPMSTAATAEISDIATQLSNLTLSTEGLESRADASDATIEAQQVIIDSLGVRLDALDPSFPIKPTEFLATATSVSNINLTWEGGFRDYSAAIVYHSTSGVGYVELIRQDGEDSTYSHSSLGEGSLHYYYVTHYDSTLEQESAQSNIDTSTTFTTPSGGDNYYVTADAAGTGDGSEGDPYTLLQAINAVVAGDTVIIEIGEYDVSARVTFATSGTLENPIVWIGTIGTDWTQDSTSSSGTQSVLFENITFPYNMAVSMSGDYNYFHKIIFQQSYSTEDNGYNYATITGDGVLWDSCAFKYPSNQCSSSNQSIYILSLIHI